MKIKTFVYTLGVFLALSVVLFFVGVVMNLIMEHIRILGNIIAAIGAIVLFIIVYFTVDEYLEKKK